MLRTFRSLRILPWLVCGTLACVLSLVVSPLYHDEGDDAACTPVIVLHDHDAHEMRSADATPSSSGPTHCFICHWQSLRSVRASIFEVVPVLAVRVVDLDTGARQTSTLQQPPSARAPPLA
jgi:hypothetical protein